MTTNVVSLQAQLEEVNYEIETRRRVYRRFDMTDPRGRSQREEHLRRMEAVKATLERLQRDIYGETSAARAARQG